MNILLSLITFLFLLFCFLCTLVMLLLKDSKHDIEISVGILRFSIKKHDKKQDKNHKET